MKTDHYPPNAQARDEAEKLFGESWARQHPDWIAQRARQIEIKRANDALRAGMADFQGRKGL